MAVSPVNWLFLGELIVVVIATAAFLFYWNRLLGGVVSAFVRLATWRWYNAYINIGSLQISPLAGRIAFRNVEYHSSNISFRATHGNITFRYWKLRVRQDGDTGSTNTRRARLPCRIVLYIEGAEIFFYNRTPAYDAIVERMRKREAREAKADARRGGGGGGGGKDAPSESTSTSRASPPAAQLRRRPNSMHASSSEFTSSLPTSFDHAYPPKQPVSEPDDNDDESVRIDTPVEGRVSWFAEAMPLEINIVTGSVILGSDATPMVFIADFKRADGVIDLSEPRSHFDYYKMSVILGLQDVTVLMRTNPDYSGPLLAHGKRAYDEIVTRDPDAKKDKPSDLTSRSWFGMLARRMPPLFTPGLSQPPVAGVPTDVPWKGLARYRLEDESGCPSVHKEDRQYAKVTTILKTRALDLCYASDSPGPVPALCAAGYDDPIGNGDLPPEWSVDIVLHGGAINYGPWADRQRDALQKAFVPQSFFDTEKTRPLRPGQTRLHTHLVVNVSLIDETTLRIPTREPSKDWMFEGNKIDAERRYGWLDVVVGANSSISYTQSQIATQYGYDSMLTLHLDSLDIASSVNLQSFVVAKSCKLSLTMPTPLVWNAQRNWGLDLTLDSPDIRLLREHVALISDLSRDWSSGATGDFRHFVPVHYSFRISLIRYAIHLFINDFNIVDAPQSRNANAFCDILGPRLDAFVAVSSTRYRPEFSVVPFTIDAEDARLEVSLPSWDTHRTFNGPREVGKVAKVKVSGSYRYYSSPKPDHQEKLKLHIEAESVAFIALGWVVRRLFCVKDNYFGRFTQFNTMQEYLEKFDHSPDSVGDPVKEKYRPGRSDSFAVHLTLDVTNSLVFMSDQVYGAEEGIAIPVNQLQLDLKNNEFQMDMTLDAAPTYVVACPDIASSYQNMVAPLGRHQDAVFVEGIFIKANRLFGPQPQGTTYFCLWELSFARIAAFISPQFKNTLSGVGAAVGYTYSDRDNAPATVYLEETPPDATFVKLSIDHVTVLLASGEAGIAVELPKGLCLDTSSMASQACRSVLGIGIPAINVHVLHRRGPNKGWDPVGSFATGASVDIYRMPEGWQHGAQEQHDFLREQDEPTRRVPYLYGATDDLWLGRHVNDIYLPRPRPTSTSWLRESQVHEGRERDDAASVHTSVSRLYDGGGGLGAAGTNSSPDWSDESRPSLPLSRIPRRALTGTSTSTGSTGWVTAPNGPLQHSDNSLGDESDTVSSVSTASSRSSRGQHDGEKDRFDMPCVLEERLQSFRRIHQRAYRTFHSPSHAGTAGSKPDGAATGAGGAKREMPYLPLSIANGSIYRIVLEPTTAEINPTTITAAYALAVSIAQATPSPGILMDQLLIKHVATVRKRNIPPTSSLYEISLPMTDLRLALGPFGNPEALVQVSLQGTEARVVQNTPAEAEKVAAAVAEMGKPATTATAGTENDASRSNPSVVDVSVGLRELRVIAGRNEKPSTDVSLLEVLSLSLDRRYERILPFVYLTSRDLGVTLHKSAYETTLQVKLGDLSGHVATPGASVTAFLADQWLHVFASLPPTPRDYAHANLIYDVLQQVAQAPDAPLPVFAREESYGLHVDDVRSLRRDPGWFTLARLRHWMALTGDNKANDYAVVRPSPPEMARIVVADLVKLDAVLGATDELFIAQPFLHQAFGDDLVTAGLTTDDHTRTSAAVFANVEALSLRHYGRLLETGNIGSSLLLLESSSLSAQKQRSWTATHPVSDIRMVASFQKVTVDIRNSLLRGVRAVLTQVDSHRSSEIRKPLVVKEVDHASTLVLDTHLGSLQLGVTASGLRLDLSLDGGQSSVTLERNRTLMAGAVPHTLKHDNALVSCLAFSASVREAPDAAPATANPSPSPERVVMVTSIRGVRCTGDKVADSADPMGGKTRLLLGVDTFEFDSYPPLKAFYNFARSWRTDHYPLYAPTIQQAKEVFERRAAATPLSEPEPETLDEKHRASLAQELSLDLQLNTVRLQARVAKGLWLAWEMGHLYATRQGTGDNIKFGLRVEPQTVGAYTTPKRIKTRDSSIIRLPSINATGSYHQILGRTNVTALINLGLFTGIIKPAVLDRLLLLHQKIGNDIIEVVREYRQQRKESPDSAEVTPPPSPAKPKPTTPQTPLLFNVQASFAGIRVGLRADDVPATVMFEALNLQSSVGNAEGQSLKWSMKATHVGLSLIRITEEPSYHSTEPTKGVRSVSLTGDISAHEDPGTKNTPSKVQITLSRIHTVMHLAALSEVSDLIRSWTSDIAVLRQVHRDEVEEVKEQTTMVLKKLDPSRTGKTQAGGPAEVPVVVNADAGAEAIETWFASRVITFEIQGLGIAVPLTTTIDVGQNAAGPALLCSVREISLVTSRNETARFRVQNSFLQFVDKFDLAVESHFSGSSHQHRAINAMVLPTIDAEGQLMSNRKNWSINAHCAATDFKLTLTPSIADRIACLTEMYEEGRAQLSAMERGYLAEWTRSEDHEQGETIATKYDNTAPAPPGRQLVVRMSFRFDSGLVELYRSQPDVRPKTDGHGHGRLPKGRTTHDNIVLPTVSVWLDYTGAEAGDDNVRTLLFNMAVHESRNTLRPTILPFFVEIVNRMEARSKAKAEAAAAGRSQPLAAVVSTDPSPNVSPRVPSLKLEALPTSPGISPRALNRKLEAHSPTVATFTDRAVERIADAPTGKLRLLITLRIDRSEMRLSCAPDSNAYIDLKWESGGFSLSTLLGGKDVTCLNGSVSGVTAYLSHEFAEQDRGCITAGAKDMAFTVTVCDLADPSQGRGISVVFDTQVAVQFRLEAFSAWLIFMSVWVDNAPKIGALIAEAPAADHVAAHPILAAPPMAPAVTVTPPTRPKLSVAILLRIRSIDFDANVSVTQARLQLAPIVLRTVSDGEKTEVEATITKTTVTAEGDISGNIMSDNLKFTSVRRSSRTTDTSDPTVLSLAISGGNLSGNMFINKTNIVRFSLAPTVVTLKDNWHEYAALKDPNAQIALDFIVNAGKFSGVLRLPAIPRLLGNFYSIFDLVESQNKIAAQRSETFKHRRKRSDSVSTPMTTVVLPAAKVSGPAAARDHVKTAQTMSFKISGLDVGIFADDYEDGTTAEFYRFYIGQVEADLKRREERPSGLPLRELLLHVSFVEWQTSNGRNATRIEKEKHDMSPTDLIDAAVRTSHRDVVVLPSMTLTMQSTESRDPPTVNYDFDVLWGKTNGDIMILPNFFDAAYKSFKKCMSGIDEQAMMRARRRGVMVARRKKDGDAGPTPAAKTPVPLAYVRRGSRPWNNPIPRLRALGETTGDAAMLIPKIRSSVDNLPTYSHRFVTLPLEDAMDLLLKLYERQMPDIAAVVEPRESTDQDVVAPETE